MNQFFTREKANEGIDLDLTLPDGTPTDFKIRIRGRDSDEFRKAQAESRRRLFTAYEDIKAKKKGVAETLDAERERLAMLCALIVSWNLRNDDGTPCECTEEAKKHFLSNAPQIADEIDRLASDRSLFFRNGSNSSEPTPEPSLS